MRTWQPLIGFVALAITAAPISPALAQVEVIPALGYYNAVGGWTQQEDDGSGYPPLRRQLGTALVAARLSVPIASRVSLQATFAVTPSQVAVSTASGTVDINAGVFLARAGALFKVLTLMDGPEHRREQWDLLLGAGVGVVHRAGTAWQDTRGVTAPTIVLEGGFAVGTFRLMLEDYISWAQFDGGLPSQTRARIHHDLVGTLGFALRLGGR